MNGLGTDDDKAGDDDNWNKQTMQSINCNVITQVFYFESVRFSVNVVKSKECWM